MSKSQVVPVGFVAAVLALVKGGDEGKVTRFQQRAIKFCNKQIKENENKVEEYNDKIDDLNDNLKDALLGVDLDAIKSTSTLKGYIEDYISGLAGVNNQIKGVEDQKDDCQDQIDKFKALIGKLK